MTTQDITDSELLETSPSDWTPDAAHQLAAEACAKIAPLWPLRHFVAVNPFLGLTGRPFAESCEQVARVAPGGMQMAEGFYRERIESGEIRGEDLEAALARAGETPDLFEEGWLEGLEADSLRAAILEQHRAEAPVSNVPTFAEVVDELQGTKWQSALVESAADFCAAWLDEGQSAWRLPWREDSLYAAWKKQAAIDRQLEVRGLAGFRQAVAALPDSPDDAIVRSLATLGIRPAAAPAYLHRLLLSVRGWAGYIQYRIRDEVMRGGGDDGTLRELLAILLAGEAILRQRTELRGLEEYWPPASEAELVGCVMSESTALAYLAQLAHEHAWERRMTEALSVSPPTDVGAEVSDDRPDVQAVFCIDVRSEIFRRALESTSAGIRTSGFAGFFGLPIEYRPVERRRGQAQCPVLLAPQFEVPECHHDPEKDREIRRKLGLAGRISHGWNAFKTSAISCFSFVETAGLLFAGSLLRDGFGGTKKENAAATGLGPSIEGIAAGDRLALAHGILKNLGLTGGFGRLVLLCGHGSETANNPYGSGLDCGACGGHAGDANARVGAALLNDPAIREQLASSHGIEIPDDTWFLAGLHNTTTDEVTLFDGEKAPASHAGDIAVLERHLADAGARSRVERSSLLGLSPEQADLDRDVRSRARDWSQVRPEWGLAGNAAFVAAPRARTRKADLGGRVFLHDYDHRADPDNGILELIMTAPMVVANWINLQYFGSTVSNEVFGSGNKVLHNVVGTVGVCLGNDGDLQTGLPWQSVHDGERFIHEPLRLHAFLEAPRERIDAVLDAHEGVRELVENQWLLLFSVDDEGAVSRRLPQGGWE